MKNISLFNHKEVKTDILDDANKGIQSVDNIIQSTEEDLTLNTSALKPIAEKSVGAIPVNAGETKSGGMVVSKNFATPITESNGNISVGLGGDDRQEFLKSIKAFDIVLEKNDEQLTRGGIHNIIASIDKRFDDMPTDEALTLYFGYKADNGEYRKYTTQEMVEKLKRLGEIMSASNENAVKDFEKLSPFEQERIVRKHYPEGRISEYSTNVDASGGNLSLSYKDNPDFNVQKATESYKEYLASLDVWKNFQDMRKNFSPEIVEDAVGFKTAFDNRSDAINAYIDKFTNGSSEYKLNFSSAVGMLSPELRAGFWERVFARIGESYGNTHQNIKDTFFEASKDSRIVYGLAEEMKLIDENGNLKADKISDLQKAFSVKQKTMLTHSLGSMGGIVPNSPYDNLTAEQVNHLFDEGKKSFEYRKNLNLLRQMSSSKFSYSDGEWKTLEDAIVNGEYVLRSLAVGFGVGAITKSPSTAFLATSSMMFAEETSGMYADLRFNHELSESTALNASLMYGTTSTLLEQFQVSKFSKFFKKNSHIAETFKQYLANGIKEASKRLIVESAEETFVEFGQASLGYATRLWSLNHEDANYDERKLWNDYCAEVLELIKTMPIITGTLFGAGAPFRARGYLKKVGADYGSAMKALYTPSDVFENNVQTKAIIEKANRFADDVKSKIGNTESGREWLGKYFSATTEEERTTLLNERYTDDNERYDVKMMLDELSEVDAKATREWLKLKAESAKKREDEAHKILNGDDTDISIFDNEVVDEKGNRSYEVLESAIDTLGMRDGVAVVNTAQELADAGGISLRSAEEIINNKKSKGFYNTESGKIVIINPHFKNGVDALMSFAHEYGHKIMAHIRETDANGYKRMCNNVLTLVGGETIARQILPESYSRVGDINYESSPEAIAEEVLMRVVEQVAYKKVLDTKKRSVWEHFKGWFKKFFDEKSLADITNEQLAEIALDVLQREKNFDVSLPAKPSKNWRAKTPEADGAEVSGEWAVMDASELLTSIDKGYDDALQPRNRSRQSSKEQVLSIANNLDPERLDNDPTTSDGAPIIDDRNMVVSGNGRILAIRQAYEFGKADEYRRHVQNRAKAMGIDIPKDYKNPVLVRKVNNTGGMSIEELASRSNKSSVAGMSVAEQAVADGRRIIEEGLLEHFFPSADGNILAESNRDFNNAFLAMVGGGELYRNKDGSLRANLAPRVKAGILCAMLNRDDNREIVERLLDNPEGYSSLINGLMSCASNIAELTQKPMYDISAELSQAVELYIEMHEKGQTVAEFSAQDDMFRPMPDDVVMFLCKLFEDNQRTSSGISGVLKEYALQCKKIDTATANLFGDEDPSKFDKLQSAYNHYATDIANQDTGANLKASERDESTQYNLNPKYDSFRNELKEFFNKYPHRHDTSVLIGNTPNVLTILGLESKPIKIKGAVLMKVAKDFLKGRLYPEEILGQIGDAIEKPVFIEESAKNSTNPQGILIHTNLMYNGKNLAVVFRLNDENGEIHSISSIYSRSEKQIQSAIEQRRIRYIDRSKAPKMFKRLGLQLPVRLKLEELYYGGKTLTDFDLSQQNSSLKAKYDETRSQAEIDELNAKFRELYEQYKNGDQDAYKQAVELVKAEAERKGYNRKGYHTTYADFTEFDKKRQRKGQMGKGFYFSDRADYSYGNKKIDVYLDDSHDFKRSEKYGYSLVKNPEQIKFQDPFTFDENGELIPLSERFNEGNPDMRWKFDEEMSSPEDIIEAKRQYDEVVAKYKGTPLWLKAPNGQPTKLTETQWVMVRTPNFKNWFGDWETLATINEVESMPAISVEVHEALDKAGIKEVFKSFGEVQNKKDGRSVIFPSKSAGKIYYHKGFDTSSIIRNFKPLFENSTHIISEKEEIKENHKVHPNVLTYEHYVNKFVVNKEEYYIRFTVPVIKNDKTANIVHSSAISEVSIYKNGDSTMTLQKTAGNSSPSFIDDKLSKFLSSVNKKDVSKVIDENGEPLVVYHGTSSTNDDYSNFTIFKNEDNQHFFSDEKDVANSMGEYLYESFLNIKKPFEIDANGDDFGDVKNHKGGIVHFSKLTDEQRKKLAIAFDVSEQELEENWGNQDIDLVRANVERRIGLSTDEWAKRARAMKYDGVVFTRIRDGGDYSAMQNPSTVYVAFNSNQIKSATDNVGTFSQSNDIRWKVDEQIETPQFKAWFGNSKVVDENGKPLHVYHGTSRGDRVGDIFDPKRSTSGPMAFFTDNKDIATNYSTGKLDTSVEKEGLLDSFDNRFVFTLETGRKVPFTKAWGFIPFAKRREIIEKAKHITLDDEAENIIYDENANNGLGQFSYHLKYARDNAFKALVDEWLESGTLMREDEVRFLQVLKLVGVENVEFLDPYKQDPKVYDVFLRIENPFDTSNIKKTDIAGLKRSAKKAQKNYNPDEATNVDMWDKSAISPEEWIEKFESDLDSGKTYAWTQIPDFVSDYLKSKGYDGIKDSGGKFTDVGHTVWIPFSSSQIKDATGENNGDFSLDNPSIKWKVDTVLMPIDINILVAQNIDALMNAIRKAHKPILAKKAELEKKYSQEDKDRDSKIQNDLRIFIFEKFSSEVVPIAKLSDDDFKFYRKQFGVRDRFVYTSFGYAIEHYFNSHPDTPIENYLFIPDTIINPDKKKEVGKWIKDEWGQPLYDASEAFIKEYDKWHVSTIKVDAKLTSSGKKLIAFKNFYEDAKKSKEPYKNKKTIEDFWKNALSSSDSSRRYANISHAQKSQSLGIASQNNLKNQEENSTRLKFLLRQERSENPVYWASIVLAKEILRGRAINGAKLEKVLPSEKFDGTQRQYAIDRAKLIAEQCKATQEDYINRLDQAVKLAENDVYWTRDIVQEMNNSFRRDGEEYGIVRQKLTQWLKDEQRKDLEKVKGLTSGEIGIDVADAIENALEAEPERKKADATPVEEIDEEISDDAEEGIDNELVGTIEKLAPSNIRDIITQVRVGVLKVVKRKNGDEQMRRRLYRNTLVEVLREATKRLTYGKEREAILAKIAELSTKGYAVIKIKDGERAGQKIDNYTLRAEHIALRIFNRGVRDTKEALLEKFDKLLKHAKAPARIKRDDKRKMTGKSEERAYIIKQIAYMPLNSDDKTIKSVETEIENTLAVINKADSTMANDYHAKLINAVQYLEDLQRFGALKEKSRAEMAEAIEWIEKFLEDETQSHAEKVEKLKAEADHRRKIFIDAINEIERNASFDSKTRAGLRQLINTSSTFKDLLLGLGRSATGRVSAEFRQLVEDMMNDCYSATTQKENEIFRLQNEFTKMVKEIYGMNEADVFKHLLGRNDKLQEFSIQGKPMSVQVALQRLSMAEQVNYEHNVYIHCCGRSQEARAIEQRIDELEAIEEKTKEIRTEIKELEMRLETIERNSVREYADKLRSALSNEDLKLLDWFRDFYKRERESLSNANEVITGLGVPEADPFYTPMKMLREGGTNEKHQVVAIVPKSLSPRVPNSLDMDEDFGIVDIWSSRISENAHYKAFSQLNIEWRGIFAHADFHKAVNAKLGKDVLSQTLDHFNDIMSVNLVDNHKVEWIDKLNGFFAIASLGYNFGSGVRQMTGTPAFANFVGAKNVMQYAMSCLSSEGRKAMLEILKSETAQRRMQSGNNQVLVEALNNLDENKFWAWYKRNAMVFNRWGDILPIMTIGQGIYRAKTEEYAKSMPIESAKKRAMDEMWAIAEASQQSPSVMNMGLAQRRLGTAGRTLSLFTSSPQLMLSREVEAVNRFISVRTKYTKNPKDETTRKDYIEARNNLAKTLFVNHILVQGGYMLATMLWKAVLGDDWDDDDIYALLAEVIAGPFGGLIVFGRFVSATYSTFNTSVAPISGLGNTVGGIIDFIPDLLTLDYEEIAKDIDKIGKSLFAPYRDVRKVYQNATDKKEGTIW